MTNKPFESATLVCFTYVSLPLRIEPAVVVDARHMAYYRRGRNPDLGWCRSRVEALALNKLLGEDL